jgi:hypothetical protein
VHTALEYIPASVKLWKETVKLEENPEDARVLLARAVEVIPHSQELWLALARLETPDRARQVLNKARKTIPTSHEIWIAAGRLQEQEGNIAQVDAIIANGVAALKKNGAELSREQWLAEAERAEQQGSTVTAQAIIKATIHLDLDEEDRQAVWMDDAETMANKGMVASARAIYAYALNVYPQKQSLWRKAADLEKQHGDQYVFRRSLSLVRPFAHSNLPFPPQCFPTRPPRTGSRIGSASRSALAHGRQGVLERRRRRRRAADSQPRVRVEPGQRGHLARGGQVGGREWSDRGGEATHAARSRGVGYRTRE